MKWGEYKTIHRRRYYYGKMPVFNAFLFWLLGKKIVRWWVGTDALTLNFTPPGDWLWQNIRLPLHRVKTKLIDMIITEHLVVSEKLKAHLENFGIKTSKIRIEASYLTYPKKSEPKPLVLVYYPIKKRNQKFKNWVYGVDIIKELKKREQDVNWLIVHGGTDLAPFFPVINAYIRPTRHDGNPRLIRECNLNKVPYYWSRNEKPEIQDIIEFLNKIKSDWRSAKKLY